MRPKTSKYKGVSKFRDRWRVRYKNKVLGFTDTEEEGALLYNDHSEHKNQIGKLIKCALCQCYSKRDNFYPIGRGVNSVTSYCKLCSNIIQVLYENNLPKTEDAVSFALMVITLHKIKYKLLDINESKEFYSYNRQ